MVVMNDDFNMLVVVVMLFELVGEVNCMCDVLFVW